MIPDYESQLYDIENPLAMVELAMAAFYERVTKVGLRPNSGAFFLGQGYLWSLAVDRAGAVLAAMAIKEGSEPINRVTILTFADPHPIQLVDAEFSEKGVPGFLAAVKQEKDVDDESKYPVLLGPFKLITGQMGAHAEMQKRGGSGQN